MKLEKIVHYLPLGAVILIGLGVLRTSVYYNYFGVDIMSYLTTSEVLTLFLNDFQPLIVLFLVAFIHLNSTERIIEIIERNFGEDIFETFVREKKWRYFTIFLILSAILFCIIYFDFIQLKTWLIYLLVFSLLQLTIFFFIRKTGDDLVKNRSYMNLFLGLCIVSIIPLMSLKDIRSIEKDNGMKAYLRLNDDSTIVSSENNLFLGKAGENYFFYRPDSKITTIIKSTDVKRIDIMR
jgi:hypothetical protein